MVEQVEERKTTTTKSNPSWYETFHQPSTKQQQVQSSFKFTNNFFSTAWSGMNSFLIVFFFFLRFWSGRAIRIGWNKRSICLIPPLSLFPALWNAWRPDADSLFLSSLCSGNLCNRRLDRPAMHGAMGSLDQKLWPRIVGRVRWLQRNHVILGEQGRYQMRRWMCQCEKKVKLTNWHGKITATWESPQVWASRCVWIENEERKPTLHTEGKRIRPSRITLKIIRSFNMYTAATTLFPPPPAPPPVVVRALMQQSKTIAGVMTLPS